MARSRYPEECPVFQVTAVFPTWVRGGAIVEGAGLGLADDQYSTIIVHAATTDAVDPAEARAQVDFWGAYAVRISPLMLRPLTRAARDMLALVEQ